MTDQNLETTQPQAVQTDDTLDAEIKAAAERLAAAKAAKESALRKKEAEAQIALAAARAAEEERIAHARQLALEAQEKVEARKRKEAEDHARAIADQRAAEAKLAEAARRAEAERLAYTERQKALEKISEEAHLLELEAQAIAADKLRERPPEPIPDHASRITPDVTPDSDNQGRLRLFARTSLENIQPTPSSPTSLTETKPEPVPSVFQPRNGKLNPDVFSARFLNKPFPYRGSAEFTANGYHLRLSDAMNLSHILWRNGVQLQLVDDGSSYDYHLEIVDDSEQRTRATITHCDELAHFSISEIEEKPETELSTAQVITSADTKQLPYMSEEEESNVSKQN